MKKYEKRLLQVSDQIKKELSLIINNDIRDPNLGMVTVTGVRLSDDLKFARVFVSILGDQKKREKNIKILKNAIRFIRKELASRVRLRYIPELSFEIDDSLDKAFRIETLLNEIKDDESKT